MSNFTGELIADITEIPYILRQLDEHEHITVVAANKAAEPMHTGALERLVEFSNDTGRLVLGALSKHLWSVRVTDYEHLGQDIITNLAQNSGWADYPSVLIAPSSHEINNHTGQKSNRFRNVAEGTTLRLCDTDKVTDLRLRKVADFKAFIPYDMTTLQGKPAQPSLEEAIERDKKGGWYEHGIWTGSRDVLPVTLSSASSVLASYCKGFGSHYLVAAAHGDYWVFMPAEMGRRQLPANMKRLAAHITSADAVIVYDPGSDEYTDTMQLGIKDEWFPDEQTHYDVDVSGVEVTKVERARNRIRFSEAGSYEFGFGRVDPADCDWTGPAEQVIKLT